MRKKIELLVLLLALAGIYTVSRNLEKYVQSDQVKSEQERKMDLVVIDSGHGGSDPGAVYQGRREKDDTLRLTLAVGEILQENGIEILYTRTTDVYLSPYERAVEANQAGVDFFLSIHRNSYPTDNEVMGVESLIYDLSGLKYQMAQEINEQLETVGFVDLGVKARPNLVVLKRTRMPAVLVEVGFINSDTDNELFDSNFQDIAQAIATGVLDTLENAGVLKEPETPVEQTKYRIQVGLFRNRNNAARQQETLEDRGFPAYIDQWKQYYRVISGEYDMLDEAVAAQRRLKRAGFETLLIQ